MFRKSSPEPATSAIPRSERAERREQSVLQSGVKLDGDLTAEGDLTIEGRVTGTIRVKGLLAIGSKAEVEGVFTGGEVIIQGKLRGTVHADHRIRLAREARVTGDLYCSALVIEDGVHFQGSSNMGERSGLRAEKPGTPLQAAPPSGPTAPGSSSPAGLRGGESASAHLPSVAAQTSFQGKPQPGGMRTGSGLDLSDSQGPGHSSGPSRTESVPGKAKP